MIDTIRGNILNVKKISTINRIFSQFQICKIIQNHTDTQI